jgi:hypothetical protein
MKLGFVSARAMIAAALLMSAPSANAATIVLNDIGGAASGSQAGEGFKAAAAFWSHMLTNNVTININVGFSSLDPGVLGQTGSTFDAHGAQFVEARLKAFGTTALDAQVKANLPTLDANGTLNVITSGYVDAANKLGTDTSYQVFDNDGSTNNGLIGMTTANGKALGYVYNPTMVDGEVQFSSDYSFDFDPTDGITPGSIDFIGVATHEIGHALGFVSGVDDYDYLGGPNGPLAGDYKNFSFQDDWWGETLDLFRYSANSNGFDGGGAKLDWSVGTDSYFSIDKGASAFMNGQFSTGYFNGDGNQASHWKDNNYFKGAPGCPTHSTALGIMDPTFSYCEGGIVTALDLAAFDAIGWNTRVDELNRPDIKYSTADIFRLANVPEPSTWALMIGGFGLAGLSLRRRRTVVA